MKCELCNKKIDGSFGSGRFCDRSCSNSFSSRIRRKERNDKISLALQHVQHFCKICNKDSSPRNGGTSRYCSEHKGLHGRDILFEDIKSDETKKKRLIKEYGHRCEICKLTEWMEERIPLVMDHINGDSDDSSRENLRIICHNCHAQTDTFGGKNKGKYKTRRSKFRKDRSRWYR